MKRKMSDEELLDFYIDLGNDIKRLCDTSKGVIVTIGNNFGKTNDFTDRIRKISKELDELQNDLENSMPYNKISAMCKKRGISPFNIFYGEKIRKEENK